jgi:hypothetical protein
MSTLPKVITEGTAWLPDAKHAGSRRLAPHSEPCRPPGVQAGSRCRRLIVLLTGAMLGGIGHAILLALTRQSSRAHRAATYWTSRMRSHQHQLWWNIRNPFARSDKGAARKHQRAGRTFLLLTLNGMARIQVRLLADIAGVFGSNYVTEGIRKAQTLEEVHRDHSRRSAGRR